MWHCWHCDWSGGLKEGKERKANSRTWTPKTYRRPVFHDPLAPDAKALAWLRSRGITEEVFGQAKIDGGKVYMPQVEEEVYAIQFPYFQDGECINIKYRQTDAKNFRMFCGAQRILYGHDDIAETTIIVEGEIDKLSLAVAGYRNAVSVPDGAPAPNTKNYSSKFEYLDAAKDKLDSVKRFILAVDNDAPGQKLEEELARRLGRERCLRVTWPEACKDANDVLLKHGKEALVARIDHAKPYPLAGVFEVLDLSDKVIAIYERGMPPAAPTGWRGLEGLYSVRPGELTTITGIPSHGKSAFVDAMMINLAQKESWSFGVFSPENQPLDNCLAVWRDMSPDNRIVEIHVQKIRFKDVGQAGHKAELVFHRPANRFYDVDNAPREVIYGYDPKARS